MRNHYFQYNDILLIDSTYKTNKYSYPLVIISVANKGKNIIFAVAFINDETQATYKWVLNSFLNLMESVHPTIIISDKDLAIMSAIQEVFPIHYQNQIEISKKNY